ncbi:hypothetical protein [Nocardia gipuzkoensis]
MDKAKSFTVVDLDRVHSELPDVQFVVVVPQRVEHSVYEHAEQLGLCVYGFTQLANALGGTDDVSRHQRPAQAYLLRRLRAHKSVSSVRRIGFSAFEIERTNCQNWQLSR